MKYELSNLVETANSCSAEINNKWVPVRPLRLTGFGGLILRIKCTWMVLTDKADVVIWPEGQ